MFRKLQIQYKHRFEIFKKVYLRGYIVINGLIFIVCSYGFYYSGNVSEYFILLGTIPILFISFLFADMHDRSDGRTTNPVANLLDNAIYNDDEYQSILHVEAVEKRRKNRSSKIKEILKHGR
jgi:hypothetical protein